MKNLGTFKNQIIIWVPAKNGGMSAESPEIAAKLAEYGLTITIHPRFGWFPTATPSQGVVVHAYLTNPNKKGERKIIGIACPTKTTNALATEFKGRDVFYPILTFRKSDTGFITQEPNTGKIVVPIRSWKEIIGHEIQPDKKYRVQLREHGTVLLATPIDVVNDIKANTTTTDLIFQGDGEALTLHDCQFVLNPLTNTSIRFDTILGLKNAFTPDGKIILEPSLIKKEYQAMMKVSHPDKFTMAGDFVQQNMAVRTLMVNVAKKQALAHVGVYDPLAAQLSVHADIIRDILEGENLNMSDEPDPNTHTKIECPHCKKQTFIRKGIRRTNCINPDCKKVIKAA